MAPLQQPQGAPRFLPYLPGDNNALSSPDASEALALINAELGRLLALPGGQFWDVVRNDKSLHVCIDSFLQHRRCVGGGDSQIGSHSPPSLSGPAAGAV